MLNVINFPCGGKVMGEKRVPVSTFRDRRSVSQTEWNRALNYSTSQPPCFGGCPPRTVSRQMGSEGTAHTIFNRILGFPSPALANCRLPPGAAHMDGMTATAHAQDPASTLRPLSIHFSRRRPLDPDPAPTSSARVVSLCRRRRVRQAATACLTFRVAVSIRVTPCDAVSPWPRQTSTPTTGRCRLSIPRPLFRPNLVQTLAEGNRFLLVTTLLSTSQGRAEPRRVESTAGSGLPFVPGSPPPPPKRSARVPTTRLVLIIKNHTSQPWTSHHNTFGLSDQGWLATRLAPVPTSLPTTSPHAPIQGPPFRFHPLINIPSPACLFGDGPLPFAAGTDRAMPDRVCPPTQQTHGY